MQKAWLTSQVALQGIATVMIKLLVSIFFFFSFLFFSFLSFFLSFFFFHRFPTVYLVQNAILEPLIDIRIVMLLRLTHKYLATTASIPAT